MQAFLDQEFLPASALSRITALRVTDPQCSMRAAKARKRRTNLTPDGKLNILAADHPARRVTKVGDDPLKMADRNGYLARIVRVLQSDAVDGVMATMDVLEDLLILHHLILEAGGPGFLDDRLLIASLNRGGLAGAKDDSFETGEIEFAGRSVHCCNPPWCSGNAGWTAPLRV